MKVPLLCVLMLLFCLNLYECGIDLMSAHQCTHEPPKPQEVSHLLFVFYSMFYSRVVMSNFSITDNWFLESVKKTGS